VAAWRSEEQTGVQGKDAVVVRSLQALLCLMGQAMLTIRQSSLPVRIPKQDFISQNLIQAQACHAILYELLCRLFCCLVCLVAGCMSGSAATHHPPVRAVRPRIPRPLSLQARCGELV